MKSRQTMVAQPIRFTGPKTEEALLAERQRFFGGFTSATTAAIIFMAVLLSLMGIFLT